MKFSFLVLALMFLFTGTAEAGLTVEPAPVISGGIRFGETDAQKTRVNLGVGLDWLVSEGAATVNLLSPKITYQPQNSKFAPAVCVLGISTSTDINFCADWFPTKSTEDGKFGLSIGLRFP